MSYRKNIGVEVKHQCETLLKCTPKGEQLGKLTKAKENQIARLVKYWVRAIK